MSLHAVDALEDAYDATRSLLWPVDAGIWVRVAVLSFFVAGAGGLPFGGRSVADPTSGAPGGVAFPAAAFDVGDVVVPALALLLGLIALVMLYLGSVLEFVLVDGLRSRDPRPFRAFGRHRWPGTQLFAFRIVLLLTLLLVLAFAAAIVIGLRGPGVRLIGLVFAVPVVLVAVPLVLLVNGFTTVFVVPIALATGDGILDSWRRLWTAIREDPGEFGAYLIVGLVLSAVGSALVSVIAGLVGLVAALPLGAAAILAMVFLGASPLAFLLAIPLILTAILILLAVAAVVRVPVLVYLRYYAIYVLAGVTTYDLRPEAHVQPAVRRVD